ncbi:hypothetical protein [Candidatus Uabimicrobium sp. HlEnr_7]|uniref:hypothetical protein n=1 Tax=Candidatus Uabimicrobium helgolandensis TaxID=3095367 RepID=UPI00355758D0
MIFPWLKKIEDIETNFDKKVELQQQQVNLVKQENESIRKECEGIRRMFVDLLAQTTKLMAQNQSNSSSPVFVGNVSEETIEELETLKQENTYLKQKIDAQEEIIQRLHEELEESENE